MKFSSLVRSIKNFFVSDRIDQILTSDGQIIVLTDHLKHIDFEKLRKTIIGKTVDKAKQIIRECPHGDKIVIKLCKQFDFSCNYHAYNTVRLLIDNNRSDDVIVRDVRMN